MGCIQIWLLTWERPKYWHLLLQSFTWIQFWGFFMLLQSVSRVTKKTELCTLCKNWPGLVVTDNCGSICNAVYCLAICYFNILHKKTCISKKGSDLHHQVAPMQEICTLTAKITTDLSTETRVLIKKKTEKIA